MLKKIIPCYLAFSLGVLAQLPIFGGNRLVHMQPIKSEREWIVHSYLPKLSGSILYIGVGSYTTEYYLKVQNPHLFETIDILEERAIYGSPFKHHIGDFMLLDTNHPYDHVSLFGILGFHLKKYAPFETPEAIGEALWQVHKLVKIGGTLHLGANHNLLPDQNIAFWEEQFEHPIFDKYEIITLGLSPESIIWWGRKKSE